MCYQESCKIASKGSRNGQQVMICACIQEHARLSGDLEKLPPQREAKQAEQLLASEIAGLERDIQFKTAELQGTMGLLKHDSVLKASLQSFH